MVNFGEIILYAISLFITICLCVLVFIAEDRHDTLKQQVADFKECMEYNFEEQCMHILEEKEWLKD